MPATGVQEEGIQAIHEEPATYSDAIASSDDENASNITTSSYTPSKLITSTPKKLATFESIPVRERHEDFLRKAMDMLLKEAVFDGTNRLNKVLEWHSPEELKKIIDFNPKKDGSSHEELLDLLKKTVNCSVKTGHPYFVNQLFSSLDPYGLVGQWATDALNPSVYTYEVSPVFVLMEEIVLKEMRKFIGWENGNGDGIFCPGGSMANGYAISCARYMFYPDIKEKGLNSLPRLVIFTSEDAHYSIKKLASFLGMGMQNVYLIKTDDRGRMDPDHLVDEVERAFREGAAPFMVCATAGTTVFGAFDPLEKISDVCEKYNMWLHVDAAWGGGVLMSKEHRYRLKGIERADSVTWNPHKLLTVPQQCSTLSVKHEGLIAKAHTTNACYLFQKDKFYDTKYDTGDKHVQCGRRVDVLKFWIMWKAKGTAGFEKHINKVFENAKFFLDAIKNRPGFELVLPEPECTNICFWYIPESLRNAKQDSNYKEKLHKIAPKIKEKMMKEGSMMVTYNAQKDYPNFFRIVFQNSGLEKSDMLYFIQEIERLGKDL